MQNGVVLLFGEGFQQQLRFEVLAGALVQLDDLRPTARSPLHISSTGAFRASTGTGATVSHGGVIATIEGVIGYDLSVR